MNIRLKYKWEKLLCKNGKPYLFPADRRKVTKDSLNVGGVYRWVIIHSTKKKKQTICLYVGEASNLYNRLYGYLYQSQSQATSYRIGKALRKLVRQGHEIRFQLLRFYKSTLNGININNENLGNMHLRQLIEQSIIYREKRKGQCEMNREKSIRGNGS